MNGSAFKQWFGKNHRVFIAASTATGLVVALRLTGLLQTWEWAVADMFFRALPQPERDDRLLLVEISETDLEVWKGPAPARRCLGFGLGEN